MAEETRRSLEDDLRNYENKWVAILEEEERIVGSGDTPIQAKAEADASGYTEAALFKVRPFDRYYVPTASTKIERVAWFNCPLSRFALSVTE